MAASAPLLTPSDPRSRREALFRLHSTLRSADRLRPDEAFDALVALYEVWVEHGFEAMHDVAFLRRHVAISEVGLEKAAPELWAILDSSTSVTGSDLFQELVDVGARSGWGQYFTPLPAAKAMAAYLRPQPGETWLDPFCGSGLLLGEVACASRGRVELFGVDVDRRVLRLAEIEGKLRHPQSPIVLIHGSSLDEPKAILSKLGATSDGVDGIVTNPPFGALDLQGEGASSGFALALNGGGTPIEVLGLEQSLRLLRPGGRMGIVLPQSVFSNKRMEYVRTLLQDSYRILGVLSLPPETFAMFNGVGKASVVFVSNERSRSPRRVWFGLPRSVGWDATGRLTEPEDLSDVAKAMRERRTLEGRAEPRADPDVARNLTAEWQLRAEVDGVRLGELVETVFTGRTAPRSAYCTDDGQDVYRAVKVGNLTGAGISWTAGDRAFARFKRVAESQTLRIGDVVLTAAAHHPRYIGAKVDIVDELPSGFATRCLPSGELLVIRPLDNGIDPRVLLMWLRTHDGRAAIQACITGQTAHLHAEYVVDVVVPHSVINADTSEATRLLSRALARRREAERLASEASEVFHRCASSTDPGRSNGLSVT